MNWQIDIPYMDRGDLVLDAITAAKQEFGEDDHRTRLVEVLATDALHSRGITSVGELIDELDGLDRPGARARLDWARAKLGLPSTGEVDKRREDFLFDAEFKRLQPPPPRRWSELQGCHAKGCTVMPTTPAGALRPVSVERWWCPAHEHLAEPGDMDPHESPYTGYFTAGGRPIPTEKEKARISAEIRKRDEPRERERRQREELRAAEADAIEEAKQRYADEGVISVLGVRTRPDLRIIE